MKAETQKHIGSTLSAINTYFDKLEYGNGKITLIKDINKDVYFHFQGSVECLYNEYKSKNNANIGDFYNKIVSDVKAYLDAEIENQKSK